MKINVMKLMLFCLLIEVFISPSAQSQNQDYNDDFPEEINFVEIKAGNELFNLIKMRAESLTLAGGYKMSVYVIKETDKADKMPRELKINLQLTGSGISIIKNDISIKTISFTE